MHRIFVEHLCSRSQLGGGSVKLIKFLLDSGANPNIWNKNGLTPLVIAALYLDGDLLFDVAKLLLENGADINHKTREGKSALYVVCQYSDDDKTIKYFIKSPYDPLVGAFCRWLKN